MPIGADVSAKYTEEAVGGGHPTKARVIDRLALVEHHVDGKHKADGFPVGCGAYFEYSSPTEVRLIKAIGAGMNIGHSFYGDAIPFLDDSGNLYYLRLNGIVAKDNTGLAANTLYYAYAYDNAGAVALELSATGFVTSGLIPHKTGDPTRALVGILRTGVGTPGIFVNSATQRLVASSWNRLRRTATSNLALGSTASGTWAEQSQLIAVAFAGDLVEHTASGYIYHSGINVAAIATVGPTSLSGTSGSVYPEARVADAGSASTQAPFGLSIADAVGVSGMVSSYIHMRTSSATAFISQVRHELIFWG